jgi:hypothetical protein
MMSVHNISFGRPQSTFNSFSFHTSHFQHEFQLSTKALHMIRGAILAAPASRMVGLHKNIFIFIIYIYILNQIFECIDLLDALDFCTASNKQVFWDKTKRDGYSFGDTFMIMLKESFVPSNLAR